MSVPEKVWTMMWRMVLRSAATYVGQATNHETCVRWCDFKERQGTNIPHVLDLEPTRMCVMMCATRRNMHVWHELVAHDEVFCLHFCWRGKFSH